MSYKRRVRPTSDYTGTVYCQDDECRAEMEATYTPGSPGSWDAPPYGPDVDGPTECPQCGRKTTKRDRDAWCERLGEIADERE